MTSETFAADVEMKSLRDAFGSSAGTTPARASNGSASSSSRPFESAIVRRGTGQNHGFNPSILPERASVTPGPKPGVRCLLSLVYVRDRRRLVPVYHGRLPVIRRHDWLAIAAVRDHRVWIPRQRWIAINDGRLRVGHRWRIRHGRRRRDDGRLRYDRPRVVIVTIVEQRTAPVHGCRAAGECAG